MRSHAVRAERAAREPSRGETFVAGVLFGVALLLLAELAYRIHDALTWGVPIA